MRICSKTFLRYLSYTICPVLVLAQFSSCALLIGNVKPVDEKSQRYKTVDLSKDNGDWAKLGKEKPVANVPNPESSESSDIAFQSKRTSSIISLDSACRPTHATEPPDPHEVTRELLMGITEVSQKEEKELTIQNLPALETTVRGKLGNDATQIRAIVLRRKECVYNLMYVARPEHFDEQAAEFDRFVASLKLE